MTKSYHAHLQAQLQGLEFLSFLELHFHASVSTLELSTDRDVSRGKIPGP